MNNDKWNHDLFSGPKSTVSSGIVVFVRNLPVGSTNKNIERILPDESVPFLIGIKVMIL